MLQLFIRIYAVNSCSDVRKLAIRVYQTTHKSKYLTKLTSVSLHLTDIPPDLLHRLDVVRRGNYIENTIN